MEEKERYELLNDNCIYDNKLKEYVSSPALSRKCYMKSLTDLLNYQDREINRFTKMLYETVKHADKLNEENNKLNKIIKTNLISADKIVKENNKLKKSQKQLIVNEFKKLKWSILDASNGYWHYFNKTGDAYMTSGDLESCLKEFIDNQIKELKGEK